MLENAACPFKMYGHDASQVSTKKRDLAIFWWDRQYFCLIIKQKAGWLVGMVLSLARLDRSAHIARQRVKMTKPRMRTYTTYAVGL